MELQLVKSKKMKGNVIKKKDDKCNFDVQNTLLWCVC